MLGSMETGVATENDNEHGTKSDNTGATRAMNMEVYVRVSEAMAAADDDAEETIDSSIEGRNLNGTSSLISPPQQTAAAQHEQEQEQQHESEGVVDSKVFQEPVPSSGTGGIMAAEDGLQQEEEKEEEEEGQTGGAGGRSREREGVMPVPLTRRKGMSDVWQHQGAFRSNRKSMKSMFEEVRTTPVSGRSLILYLLVYIYDSMWFTVNIQQAVYSSKPHLSIAVQQYSSK